MTRHRDERVPARPLPGHATEAAELHPRPLLRRDSWWSLDGTWDFAADPDGRWEHPSEAEFGGTIRVPFAPETDASGIGDQAFLARCWYRRLLTSPEPLRADDRLLLHFGAVDESTWVWIDGELVARHVGGYSPFTVDVTRHVRDGRPHVLVVRADDDPHDLGKPRGKQDWELIAHSIWYPRTTGIWQSVWLERLHTSAISELQWHTERDGLEITAEIALDGRIAPGTQLRIRLEADGRELVDDLVSVKGQRFSRGFRLDVSGLDEVRAALVWTPEHPVLIDAFLELFDPDGARVDAVSSYTAIRTVRVERGHFLLNGTPWPLRLVLDQGYWPDTGLTPPSSVALRHDVELTKAMGFNGVRKHQKIEDPRFLYWADRLGLFVWYECPPAYRFDSRAVRRLTDEWTAAIERDRSHPSIICWVPFNESSGVTQVAEREDQRAFVEGLTLLTKAIDPTRPVVANDGWETSGGDIIGIHDYEQDPGVLAARWNSELGAVLSDYGNHGRLQTLDEDGRPFTRSRGRRALVLTEFGGIGWDPGAPVEHGLEDAPPDGPEDRITQPASWGYSTVASAEEFAHRYEALLAAVHAIPHLAGFCYTQLTDTYQEVNGLLRADRTPKLPVEVVAAATRGLHKSFFDPLST